MATLGILVTNLSQEHEYFTDIASVGLQKNVQVYIFLPSDIDFRSRMTKGKKYCTLSNCWINSVFPIPMFIYDRCFYWNDTVFKENYPIVSWLKSQRDVQFIGHGLPNKWVVYNALKTNGKISFYLPETKLLKSLDQVFSFIEYHNSVLFKPTTGSQGKGIFVITKNDECFSLLTKIKHEPCNIQISKKQIEHLIFKIKKKQPYLLQPFLSLSNHNQCPFDLRIFLQKDENGKWIEVGRGIRTGKKKDFTSNLGGGGQVSSFNSWYSTLNDDFQNVFHDSLPILIEQIPITLEKQEFHLFELGLDFGFDMNGKLWLIEVNSKPGRKVILTSYPDKRKMLAEAPINYCLFLNAKS